MNESTKRVSKLVWHSDSGHAWLQVPKVYVPKGLKFSKYSYQDRTSLYLEEDMDASIFLDAMKDCIDEFTFKENHGNGDSPIRNLPHWQG